nr:5-bromo-4-chloroindolyl phosphate hydrolysis family protein [uncultured Oscillibacter sp.]
MAEQRRNNHDDSWFPWALIIFLFVIKVWPIALIMLFIKLFGEDEKKERTAPPPLRKPVQTQRGQPMVKQAVREGAAWRGDPVSNRAAPMSKRTAPAGKARTAMKKAAKSPGMKKSNAWLLKIAGAALALFGVMVTGAAIEDMLYMFDTVRWWLPEMLQGLAFLAGGGAMLFSGFSMDKSLNRYAKYLSVMGDREAVPVEELSRTLGYSRSRVEKDLQKMIDRGYFGGKAYLNVELGYLFRSGQAGAEWSQRQRETRAAQTPPTPKEAEEGYSGILRNIRRANDRIADPVLSAKIDRLEEITAKIFRAVEEDPKKRDKIDTFLNYYLPTTQKLLDSYAEFEAAGVEGENLRQAKERIESTMDAIVKGFEHQLDELYKADALDVDSDIRVMEHMLRRDTATTEDDFGLGGGTAVQSREEEA